MKLTAEYIAKPWGRPELPPMFSPPPGERIGEIWFTSAGKLPLLAKYLFTSERLSIQVHPDDAYARALGLPRGKSESWLILEAEPGARLGLGLRRTISKEELRAAALDGSIERLVDWRPVRPGDFFFIPGGTVHVIGGGITLLEFQSNVDVTYRLYDYGRPRELHLDDAVAVADLRPFPAEFAQSVAAGDERVLVDGPDFTLVHARDDALKHKRRWVIPLAGEVRCAGETAGPGECLLVEAGELVETTEAGLLIGAEA